MSGKPSVEKLHTGLEGRSGPRRGCVGRHGLREPARFFGLDAREMSPRVQVFAALAVLAPVVLSGVLLVALVPGLWWIFTTYFWIAFPAFGLLVRGLTGTNEARPERSTPGRGERELLEALRDHGELTPAAAAIETSLSVAEADRRLKELAEGGHLEVRARGGGIFYALWGEARPPARAPTARRGRGAEEGSMGTNAQSETVDLERSQGWPG